MYLPVNRNTSLKIGGILMLLGILMMPDFIVPTFTDILNFIIAMPLSSLLGCSYMTALIATWAFGIALFIVGILILPYNTTRFIRARARKAYLMFLARPEMLIATVVVIFIMWHIADWIYITQYPQMEQYAQEIINKYI